MIGTKTIAEHLMGANLVSFLFTVCNSSCGKVMFSQACIILYCPQEGMHGMGHAWQGGRHVWWGACMIVGVMIGGGLAWQGSCMAGGHVWQGVCMVGGMHGRGSCMAGGCAWQGACMAGGVHGKGGMHGKGVHGKGTCMAGGVHGRGSCMAGEMATAADSMHPTGINSCLFMFFAMFRATGVNISLLQNIFLKLLLKEN